MKNQHDLGTDDRAEMPRMSQGCYEATEHIFKSIILDNFTNSCRDQVNCTL